jgi:hypothetical protein
MKIQYRYIDIVGQKFFLSRNIFGRLFLKSNEVCQPNRSIYSNKLIWFFDYYFFYCAYIYTVLLSTKLWRNLFFLRSFKFFSMPLSWVAVTLLRFCWFHRRWSWLLFLSIYIYHTRTPLHHIGTLESHLSKILRSLYPLFAQKMEPLHYTWQLMATIQMLFELSW